MSFVIINAKFKLQFFALTNNKKDKTVYFIRL
jgi:hypothetical protein